MKPNLLAVGDTVYCVDNYDNVFQCEVVGVKIETFWDLDYLTAELVGHKVDRDGKTEEKSKIFNHVVVDRLLTTLDETYKARDRLVEHKKDEYRAEINSIKDLLVFPFHNSFDLYDGADKYAIEVYKEKCKEYLNIEIEEDE